MGGRWIGILAFALVVLSLVLHEVVGVAPALVADVAGLYAGKRGLDSRGRGFATVALIAGIAFLIFYAIMVIVGEEAFTPPDASAFFG